MLRARVVILCGTCGGGNFRGPQHPRPEDMVLCTNCGMQSRYADLEAESIARSKRLRDIKEAGKIFNRH